MLEVEVPKKWIRVSPPKKLSEETRRKMAERLLSSHDTHRNTEKGEKSA
jgi:hypothetical protein